MTVFTATAFTTRIGACGVVWCGVMWRWCVVLVRYGVSNSCTVLYWCVRAAYCCSFSFSCCLHAPCLLLAGLSFLGEVFLCVAGVVCCPGRCDNECNMGAREHPIPFHSIHPPHTKSIRPRVLGSSYGSVDRSSHTHRRNMHGSSHGSVDPTRIQ